MRSSLAAWEDIWRSGTLTTDTSPFVNGRDLAYSQKSGGNIKCKLDLHRYQECEPLKSKKPFRSDPKPSIVSICWAGGGDGHVAPNWLACRRECFELKSVAELQRVGESWHRRRRQPQLTRQLPQPERYRRCRPSRIMRHQNQLGEVELAGSRQGRSINQPYPIGRNIRRGGRAGGIAWSVEETTQNRSTASHRSNKPLKRILDSHRRRFGPGEAGIDLTDEWPTRRIESDRWNPSLRRACDNW